MELKIEPFHKNSYEKAAVLIKSPSPQIWLRELSMMQLSLEKITVFALPGTIANRIYGCLVVLDPGTKIKDIRQNQWLQIVNDRLFIPAYSIATPILSDQEWQKFFENKKSVLHPEFGFFELTDAINWAELLEMPQPVKIEIQTPAKAVFIPSAIQSLRIERNEEELKASLENPFSEEEALQKLPFNLQKVLSGNQKEMDKFLKYLDKHPEAALAMAIPLDVMHASRGKKSGKYVFGNGGNSYSLGNSLPYIGLVIGVVIVLFIIGGLVSGEGKFPPAIFILVFFIIRALSSGDKPWFASNGNSNGKSGRTALLDNERFLTLQQKYRKLADDYVNEKQYQKAANIYLKLLKQPPLAAKILEDGKCYSEAAYVYKNYCKDNSNAALCFELAKNYAAAADLYKVLNEHEKTGDMLAKMGMKSKACDYYKMVANNYVERAQYVKAALIYRKKMADPEQAKKLLLQGWENNADAQNCLNNYFASYDDLTHLNYAIQHIYENKVDADNSEIFLQVLKHEFSKDQSLEFVVRNISYEIIADKMDQNPAIAAEISYFNRHDKRIVKDVMQFRFLSKRQK